MRKALTQQRLHEQRNAFGRRCVCEGGVEEDRNTLDWRATEAAAMATSTHVCPTCGADHARGACRHEGTRDHPGAQKRDRRGVDGALPAHGSPEPALQIFSAGGALG